MTTPLAAPQDKTLTGAAVEILCTASPQEKSRLTGQAVAAWRQGKLAVPGNVSPPARPARPEKPELLAPRHMPKRGKGFSQKNRVALLHALAHIELNAIDLAWDVIARFGGEAGPCPGAFPEAFYDDWLRVADEEAHHFTLLANRLIALGAAYGDLPAHDGLWQAAIETAADPLARFAVVPLVLEARGLDVTPAAIVRLQQAGDPQSAEILQTIYEDEIGHVAVGKRWFDYLCDKQALPPIETYQALVRRYFRGALKPPFNREARDKAGFAAAFYEPLAN